VVALGIGIDGTKHLLGLVEGSTENATLVTERIFDLRERGLDVTKPILAVIDGSTALRRAILDVFDHTVIHRCQLHKVRNVESKLPDALAATVASKMRAAYRNVDPLAAEADLEALARQLTKAHTGAAASLRSQRGTPVQLAHEPWGFNSARREPALAGLSWVSEGGLELRVDGARLVTAGTR
jgi:transposase-like protein